MMTLLPADPRATIDHIDTLSDDELDKWLWKYPYLTQEMFRVMSDRFELFEDRNFQRMAIPLYTETDRKLWRGLWLGNIPANMRLLVASTLCAGPLTQEILNFMTLVDIPNARYQLIKPYPDKPQAATETFKERTIAEYHIDDDSRALAEGFSRQMIDEAAPHRPGAVLGAFVMEHTPLPYLDSLISYDTVRLITSSQGIFASLVKDKNYLCFWWSPERHGAWSIGAKHAWAINVLMSCIWRDACVVKHKMFHERRRAQKKPLEKQQKQQKKKLVLPRVVKQAAWGPDEEREKIVRTAHPVRQHYRRLPDGWRASRQARANARNLGNPEPPDGWTFVLPHQRGGEGRAGIEAMPVICLGLKTAAIALSGFVV
jgi:hypothetical protein